LCLLCHHVCALPKPGEIGPRQRLFAPHLVCVPRARTRARAPRRVFTARSAGNGGDTGDDGGGKSSSDGPPGRPSPRLKSDYGNRAEARSSARAPRVLKHGRAAR
jgi:hypothetical protein